MTPTLPMRSAAATAVLSDAERAQLLALGERHTLFNWVTDIQGEVIELLAQHAGNMAEVERIATFAAELGNVERVDVLPSDGLTIVATGPLTAPALASSIGAATGAVGLGVVP